MSSPAELSLELQVAPDIDTEELAQLIVRLRAELLDLDVDDVRQPAEREAPDDAKGGELLAAGQLIVNFATTPEVLASIMAGIRSWLGRNRVRSVKLTLDGDTLEMSDLTSTEQSRLIELWVSRHETG